MRCVPRRRRTPHAAAGDHHLEEEEERAAIGAGSQVRRERKEIETAAIQTPTEVDRRSSKSREEHLLFGGLIQYQNR